MHYPTFKLDDKAKDLCTIVTLFGMYRYTWLPMGAKQANDISQKVMEALLREIKDMDVYLDDIGCFSKNWTDHLSSLDKVLSIL